MSGPGASGPWHPPAPSLAALPVDRSKTEPKPAYYKLQFGDDVTGFSYYVRTLSVVIGRNVERPNAAHASPAPPLASFGIDAPFSGLGWTPPGQAALATPPTPALDADALAIVESAEFAAVASQWLESGGMNMGARIEASAAPANLNVARIPFGEDGLGGVEVSLEKGSGPSNGNDKMEVDAVVKLDTGVVEHPVSRAASASLTPAPSSASATPAAVLASASLTTAATASVPSPSPDNTIPVGNTAVDLKTQAAIAEPTIPSTFPSAPPEAALPDTVPTLDEKDALDLGIDAASFLVGDIEELHVDVDAKPDFSELAGFDGSELPPPPPPKPTVHLEHVDVDLGPLKSVSRNHAKIEYRSDCGQFCLEIFGRNGAWVDDRYYVKGTVVPLNQGSQIQIATRIFSFVLPPSLEDSPTQTQAVSDAMDGAYPYEQLPYPYNLPPEQVGYAEFYGEGGPGPATAATMAARVPAFNAFAASDGYGLGAESGRFADHEWIEDEWESGHSEEDDDSSDDEDYEDDDEEEGEEEDEDDEQVAPKKMVIRLKARRVIADDDDDSSLSELSSEPEPEPEPEAEPRKAVAKKKVKKEPSVAVKTEPGESPRKAGKAPAKGKTARKGVKAPTLVLKPPDDKAKKKSKKAEVKAEGAMDVDTSRAATPTADQQTTQTTPRKVKKESKVKEGKTKKKEKTATAAAAAAASTPSAAAPTPPTAPATQPKPAPRPHGLALPNLAAVEAAKKAKEAQAAQAAAAAAPAAATATQPPAAPTLAAAMAQPAAAPTPQVPPQPATLAAAQAQQPGAPATLAQVAATPGSGVPGATGAPGARPPHPGMVRPPGAPGAPGAPGVRPPAQGLALPTVRPPQPGQPQPGVPGAAPGTMQARPGMPMRPGMPGQPHPGMQVRPGQPLPPGVRPPPGMVVRPGMTHPGAPGVARPPMRPPPGRGQQVNAPADPPKPYYISELRENPLRPGHILCSVPIPPSGAGPRQPPANILGLDGKLFIGPPPLKPTATFATIIHRALTNLPRGRGTLGEVCNWVAGEWEYFRLNPEAGWQNSIRHNLSLNKAFLKVPRIPEDDPESKGSVWILDPEEGPLFEEKQRRDALKSEGKAKNAEEKRMRERMKAEERARKQREREIQMAQQAQMMRQAGAVPAAGVGGVRPRPPPVQSANRGVLPAKGKITVVIRPVDAAMRAKSVIDKTDASGVPLPFVCDGTTLVLDQATFGHLTADIVDKLQLLGAAGAVDVLSAWVVNKNKQAAAKAATKPPVRPGTTVRPGAAPTAGPATAVRPTAAPVRPPAKPAVGATGKPLPGPAPPGANLTKVISMIAEVAHARGDVNTVGPNASALLRYIRVVGVDIDLRVAERIWATGVVPPLPPKKPAANGAKPGAPVRPPAPGAAGAVRPPAGGVRPPVSAGAGAVGAGAVRPPTPAVRPPVPSANGNALRPPPNGVPARPPQPGQAQTGQTPAVQAAPRPPPPATSVQTQAQAQAQPAAAAAAGPPTAAQATAAPATGALPSAAPVTGAPATAGPASAAPATSAASTTAPAAAAPTAGVKRAFDQGPGAPPPPAANGIRPPPTAPAASAATTPVPAPAAAAAAPRPPAPATPAPARDPAPAAVPPPAPAPASASAPQAPSTSVAAPVPAPVPTVATVQAAGEDPAAKKPRLEPPAATV